MLKKHHRFTSSNYILTQAYAVSTSVKHVLLQMSKRRPGEVKPLTLGHTSVLRLGVNTSLRVYFPI